MSVISNTRFASAVSTGGAVWGVNKVVMKLAKKKVVELHCSATMKTCQKVVILCWRCYYSMLFVGENTIILN